jgi:hypothetical protein
VLRRRAGRARGTARARELREFTVSEGSAANPRACAPSSSFGAWNFFVLLIVCAVAIYLSCEWFVNAVEWLGERLNVGKMAVGTILAAFGTALPESVVTLVAVTTGADEEAKNIGVGAAMGGPLALATVAYGVTGTMLLLKRRTERQSVLADAGMPPSRPESDKVLGSEKDMKRHPPLRLRHDHAQDPRWSQHRPPHAPRPPRHHHRRLPPPRRSPRRQGRGPLALTPALRNTNGHTHGFLMATSLDTQRPPTWASQ